MTLKNRIIPCLNYSDAHTAIQFLCNAFGFEELHTFENDEGKVVHCQLNYEGNGIMLGSTNNGSEYSENYIVQPGAVQGRETQTPYVIVDSDKIDAHYQNARNHGAEILMELEEQSYGGKNYVARDPEGHIWSFGSYDPAATN